MTLLRTDPPTGTASFSQVSTPPDEPGVFTGGSRSRGLDVLRGLVVAWLLVVVYTPGSGLRGHAAWFGWDHSDVFFPMFVLIAGMGLAMQTRRRMPWPRLLRRFVSLMMLGLLVNAWLGAGPDLSVLRIPGVLQRIALAGIVAAAIVALGGRRWQPAFAAAVVVAAGWGLALRLASSNCPEGLPTPQGCGTFHSLDVAAFGASHVYVGGTVGHDPEGLASTAGALATFLAGYAAAVLLHRLSARTAGVRGTAMLAMGGVWLALFPLFLLMQPVAKRLWTPSFLAVHAAAGIALLGLAVLVFDTPWRDGLVRRTMDVLSWPLIALGRNALVLWIGVFVAGKVLATTPAGDGQLGDHLYTTYGGVGYFLLTAGAWMAVAAAMHVSRWYVRL